MTWLVEYTDTFAGEPNYSWVRRYNVGCRDSDSIARTGKCESRLAVMRRAKALAGLSGVRGRTDWHGDGFSFRPYRSCTILLGRWDDCHSEAELVAMGYESN